MKETDYQAYRAAIYSAMNGKNSWTDGESWNSLCKNYKLGDGRPIVKKKAKVVLREMRKNDAECTIYSIKDQDPETKVSEHRLVECKDAATFDAADATVAPLENNVRSFRELLRAKKQTTLAKKKAAPKTAPIQTEDLEEA